MNGRKSELVHNTPEQVREYLAGALGLVATDDVPDDLRVAYFGKAVDLLAAKSITVEQIAPTGLRL